MHKDFGQKRTRNRMIRGTTCRYVATCDTSQSKRNTLLVLLAKMWHERGFSARELCGAALLQKSFARRRVTLCRGGVYLVVWRPIVLVGIS